jgi:hypothetical protein
MFPRRPGANATQQKRERGNPKPGVGFKIPPNLLEYVQEQMDKGYSKTGVMLYALDVLRHVDEALGSSWYDLEKLADDEGVSTGTVLGRLALIGLDVERNRTPKKK